MTDTAETTLDIQEVLNEYNKELTAKSQELILAKVTISTLTRKVGQLEGENSVLRASIQEESDAPAPVKSTAKK